MEKRWIWQQEEWPAFEWDESLIQPRLRAVRLKQGVLIGRAGAVSTEDDQAAALDTLLENIIPSSAIENESLNVESVRSSLAKRLGISEYASYAVSDRSEGLAKMMVDAIQGCDQPLSVVRLLQWHRWLFPKGGTLLHPVSSGKLRGEEVMQVVSGRVERPTVHFEAPPRARLEEELERFITWYNQSEKRDGLLRAAIAHFWLITIHPFEDGNGRITRALSDMVLARSDSQSILLYSISSTLLQQRKSYYEVLEQHQRGGVDITLWIQWFLDRLEEAVEQALDKVDRTLFNSRYWQQHRQTALNREQIKVLNRLLEGGERGFEQGISASQYQKVAKVSKATATRHLKELLEKGCVEKLSGGGRSTRYQIRSRMQER